MMAGCSIKQCRHFYSFISKINLTLKTTITKTNIYYNLGYNVNKY